MTVPLSALGSSIRLRMDLAREAPQDYRAGVVVQRKGSSLGLLNLDLTGLIVIRTFKKQGSTSVVQEAVSVSSALAKVLLGQESGPVRLEFVASKPFDQLEIEAKSLLVLNYQLDVFYAYAIDANVINTAQGYVSRFASPSASNYSTAVVDNGVTVCVNSSVRNPLNAVDQDLTNYATLGSLADLSCPVVLQTQLDGNAPAGYEAGFVLSPADLLNLDVSVLDALRLTTYQGATKQEEGTGFRLLRLQALADGKYAVRFTTTKPFNRVELRRTNVLGLLDNMRLYYGFGLEPRAFRDVAPRLSAFVDPANKFEVNGAACVNCAVSNPQFAADKDLVTNYATVSNPLGALTTTRLKLRLDGPGKAGNTAGIVLGLGTGLLDADLLRSIRVNTYSGTPVAGSGDQALADTPTDGAVLVESATQSTLLNLELLSDGRQEISFLTTRDFDWVEVEISNGVAVLSSTLIYYGFAEDRPTGFPSNIVAPPPALPVQLTAFGAKANGLAVDVAWQTAAELNSAYFVVERSAASGRNFEPVGRQLAAGTTATGYQYALRDADAAQLPAGTLLYRLRQVDLDGSETYSAVAVVVRKALAGSLAVYPNPATAAGSVQVALAALPAGDYQLSLYNAQGVLVKQEQLRTRQAEVSVAQLSGGVYQVVLRDAAGQRVANQRLVLAGQ